MIQIQVLSEGILEVKPEGKLQESDFRAVAPKIEEWTRRLGSLKVLVDATGFEGWADSKAAAEHFRFVREHHQKIDRIAILEGQAWQHWLAMFAGHFVHPELKVFERGERFQAEGWLREPLRKAG